MRQYFTLDLTLIDLRLRLGLDLNLNNKHAHVEIVTGTVAVLIQIKLAIVNNLKLFTISQIIHKFSNYSQFLKFFTVVYNAALQKLHLSMLSSVRLCCLSEIALILVLFSEFS